VRKASETFIETLKSDRALFSIYFEDAITELKTGDVETATIMFEQLAEAKSAHLEAAPAGASTALPRQDGYIPTQDNLETLWNMVCVQNTGEHRACFMANWVRGYIKIPQAVRLRIEAAAAIAGNP